MSAPSFEEEPHVRWLVRTERGLSASDSAFFDAHDGLRELVLHFDARRSAPVRGLLVTGRDWFRIEVGPAGTDRLTVELSATKVPPPYGLTARELDVLTLITLGETNQSIADSLALSASTVRSHVEHLLSKLGQRRRSVLATIAVEEGLRRISEPRPAHTAAANATASSGVRRVSPSFFAPRRPLVIGAVAPDGGTGADLRRGAQLALETINRRGGVRDRPIELRWAAVPVDGDPVAVLDGWDAGAIDALTYFHGAGSAERFLENAGEREIPVLHNVHDGPAGRHGPFTYRICPSVDVYGTAFTSFVRDAIRQQRIPAGDGRVVVLGEDPGVVGPIRRGRGGAPIKGVDLVEARDEASWRSAVQDLRNDPPSAVLLASFDPHLVSIFLEAFEASSFPSLLFGLWVPGTPELRVPPPEGFVWASNSGRPRDAISANFERDFAHMHHTTPWLTAGLQFDMVGVIAHGWATASRLDLSTSVIEAIRRNVHRGVNGGYYFGDRSHDCLSFPSQISDTSLGHPRLVYQHIGGVSRRIGPTAFADTRTRTPGWLTVS